MVRTNKEEVIWFNEFSSLEEARRVLGHWIEVDYYRWYVHSALGYRSPEEFEELYPMRKASPPEADPPLAEGEVFPGEYSDMDWSEKIVYKTIGEVVF